MFDISLAKFKGSNQGSMARPGIENAEEVKVETVPVSRSSFSLARWDRACFYSVLCFFSSFLLSVSWYLRSSFVSCSNYYRNLRVTIIAYFQLAHPCVNIDTFVYRYSLLANCIKTQDVRKLNYEAGDEEGRAVERHLRLLLRQVHQQTQQRLRARPRRTGRVELGLAGVDEHQETPTYRTGLAVASSATGSRRGMPKARRPSSARSRSSAHLRRRETRHRSISTLRWLRL